MDVAWFQSRYDKAGPGGTGADYINCPLTREQYEAFVDALLAGDKTDVPRMGSDTPYFDGCLPIEVMAERGRETLRHGPMKPVGLTNPHRAAGEGLCRRAAAPGQQARHAVQHGRLPDQAEARRTGAHLPHHPGSRERASSPALAGFTATRFSIRRSCSTRTLRLQAAPRLRFAGQITGCEGYVESRRHRASWPGALPPPNGSARRAHRRRRRRRMARCSATSPAASRDDRRRHALVSADEHQFRPVSRRHRMCRRKAPTANGCADTDKTLARRRALSARALADLDAWIAGDLAAAAE